MLGCDGTPNKHNVKVACKSYKIFHRKSIMLLPHLLMSQVNDLESYGWGQDYGFVMAWHDGESINDLNK